MIEDAVKYPFRGENGLKRMLIGGLLTLFGVILLLPLIPVMGYSIRVGAATAEGHDEPVEFEDWGGLFVDGLVGIFVGFVYGVIPIAIYMILLFTVVGLGGATGSEAGVGIGLAGAAIATVLFIPIFILLSLTIPAAQINYRRSGSITAAFDVGTIKRVVLTSDYIIAILIAVALSFAYGIVAQIALITLVGWAFVYFAQYVTVFRIYGSGFRDAIGE